MAKVTEIWVEATFTKSLPNFQNIKPSAGMRLQIEEGDDVRKVYKNAWDEVGKQIGEQIALFEDEKKSGVKKGL